MPVCLWVFFNCLFFHCSDIIVTSCVLWLVHWPFHYILRKKKIKSLWNVKQARVGFWLSVSLRIWQGGRHHNWVQQRNTYINIFIMWSFDWYQNCTPGELSSLFCCCYSMTSPALCSVSVVTASHLISFQNVLSNCEFNRFLSGILCLLFANNPIFKSVLFH